MLRFALGPLVLLSCAFFAPPRQPARTRPTASQPTTAPASRPALRSPVQARIFEELLRDTERPRATPILSAPDQGGPAGKPGQASAGLLLEGTVIVDRPGRLVRSGGRSEFQFDPGNPNSKGPRIMEFNKNGLLEAMEGEAAAGVREFVISAEVTRYRGRNYLILRKYQRRVSQGNLRP